MGEVFYPDFTDTRLATEVATRKAQRDAIGADVPPTGAWPRLYVDGKEPDVVIPSVFQPDDGRPTRIATTPGPGYGLPEVPRTPGAFRIKANTTLDKPSAS